MSNSLTSASLVTGEGSQLTGQKITEFDLNWAEFEPAVSIEITTFESEWISEAQYLAQVEARVVAWIAASEVSNGIR